MYQKTILKNGLRVISVPLEHTSAVTILVLVGTGSKYETKELNGLSHFLEHMLGKGTKKRSTQLKVFEDIDRLGGKFDFGTSKEGSFYGAKVYHFHFDKALDWLSDVILNSKLTQKDIDKERGVILEEINNSLDDPAIYVHHLWEKVLYKDQPAGWLIIGEKENILKFQRRDLMEYLKKQYTSKNTVICVAGKIKPDLIEKKIEKYFHTLSKITPQKKLRVIEKQNSPQVLTYFKKTDQTHLCLGVRAFPTAHNLRYAQDVLAIILGGSSSSRLIESLRTKAGIAYWVFGYSEAYTDTGYVVSYVGVSPQNVEKAIRLILKEYKILKTKKVAQTELQKTKDYLKGHLTLSLETSDAQASFYGMQELLEQKILTPEQVFKKIDSVTPDDIMKVAQEIFRPEKLNLALVGPFKNKEKFQKLLKI